LGVPVFEPPADLVPAEFNCNCGIFTGKADTIALLRFNKLAAWSWNHAYRF